MCVRSLATQATEEAREVVVCLAVTALFTVGCDCRTDIMDCGTGVALLRAISKSTTRGKRRGDESRTRTSALERGDSYYRPGVVVRASAPQSKSRAVSVSRREGFSDGVSICGDGPRSVAQPARSNEEERPRPVEPARFAWHPWFHSAPNLMILDGVMINGNNLDQLGERRAAILLGLTTMELRQLSRLSGLGLEKRGSGEQMVYTYEELRSLGLLAAQALD